MRGLFFFNWHKRTEASRKIRTFQAFPVIFVLVIKRLNTVDYISQRRFANSLGDKPGMGNP
jgi:hypothetical protein